MKKKVKSIFLILLSYVIAFTSKVNILNAQAAQTSEQDTTPVTPKYTETELIFYYCLFALTLFVFIFNLIRNKKNRNKSLYLQKCDNIKKVQSKIKNYANNKKHTHRRLNTLLIEVNLIIDDIMVLYGDSQEVYLNYSLNNLKKARDNLKELESIEVGKVEEREQLFNDIDTLLQKAIDNIKTLDNL